jgi:hypothetical protein
VTPTELIAMLVGVGGPVVAVAWQFSRRLAAYEMKVDVCWQYITQRELAESLKKGILTQNSPLSVPPQVRALYAGLADELRAWYRKSGQYKTEEQLIIEVVRLFGKRIVEEVEVPHGLAGSGVLAAVEIARSPNPDSQ